jgi:hypothetical protein
VDAAETKASGTINQAIEKLVTEKASGFPKKSQEKVIQAIKDELYSELVSNKHVIDRTNVINAQGSWDDPHLGRLTNHLVEVANRLLGPIASKHLREKAEEIGASLQERAQRIARQEQRRDSGASGGPASARTAPLDLNKAKDAKDVFAMLDEDAARRRRVG